MICIRKFTTTFLKNVGSLECINCKHFVKNEEQILEKEKGKCKKNGYYLQNIKTPFLFSAESCRKDEKFCGPKANYFENK
jgi:hypothetical protein